VAESSEITRLLNLARQGDRRAEERLLDALYAELRRIASACLRAERKDHTLQPTALVHEAYLRLASRREKEWLNRTHFLAVAAQAMRRVLVDCARARYSKKRGGDAHRIEFDPELAGSTDTWAEELLDIDLALSRLAELDERQAKVVEMRFFAGLTEIEIGQLLGVSERTVKREWEFARAWLEGELLKSPRAKHLNKPKAANQE
jgi:RNA polymerase sigma factor (TIGR02999 family)